MLDAYIIDRIRRQKRPQEDARIPLHIEVPRPPEEPVAHREEQHEREERGITVIDFSI